MKISQGSAAERFADYITGEKLASLPADVITKAKLCFQDSIGCFLGAGVTPVARTLAGFSAESRRVASTDGVLVETRLRHCRARYATLINALDYDDIYKKGHPGATVMSAALALAEGIDCSGPDLIEAVVVGYEVSGRVGMSLTQSTPRKTLHGHGTWQTIGAVATAAKLLRLDVRQTAHAIAIAAANAPVASVMKTVYGARPSMAKNNFGAAAQVGVNSLLARHGFEGPLDIFEGETGFWRMFGADGCDAGRLTEGLGHLYEIERWALSPIAAAGFCRAASRPPLKCSGARRSIREVQAINAFWCRRQPLSATHPSAILGRTTCGRRNSVRPTPLHWRCFASARGGMVYPATAVGSRTERTCPEDPASALRWRKRRQAVSSRRQR